MKKVITIAGTVIGGALISLIFLNRANAATIAILDTSINSSQVNNIVHEVCFTTNSSCLNNQSFMDGAGSANIIPAAWSVTDMNHGTEVAETALLANPQVKIVFIRISDTLLYQGAEYMHSDKNSIDAGLAWIAKNYKQYGIQAVSISQELTVSNGSCMVDANFTSSVESLKSVNIPVLAGVGNSGLQNKTAWPACSTDVIGVGAATAQGSPYYFSNLGQGVKLMSLGRTNVPMPTAPTGSKTVSTAVMGTSIATPWAATLWATNYGGTWQNQIDSLLKLPVITDNYKNKYPFLM